LDQGVKWFSAAARSSEAADLKIQPADAFLLGENCRRERVSFFGGLNAQDVHT